MFENSSKAAEYMHSFKERRAFNFPSFHQRLTSRLQQGSPLLPAYRKKQKSGLSRLMGD